MLKKAYSIKQQLIVYSFLFSILLGCSLFYASYRISLEEINEILDKQMQNLATHVAQQAPNHLVSHFDPTQRYHEEDLFIDVWSYQANQGPIHPQKILVNKQTNAGFYAHHNQYGKWNTYVLPLKDRQIQISQQQSVRQNLALELAGNMLVPYLFFIPFALFGFYFIIRKSLTPFDDFKTQLAQRSSADLHPIKHQNYPLEMLPTIDEINYLFERIEDYQEQQKQFIADAAHELRTPLTALNLQAKILLTEFPQHPAVDKLNQGLIRIQHLVLQLLELAKQEANVSQNEIKEKINIAQNCVHHVEQLIDLALQKDIDLGVERLEDIYLYVYPSALSSIIYNLLDNAIKYTPQHGIINVSIFKEDQFAYIQIEDSGAGISDQEQQHIFKRFYRIHQHQNTGSGLGLAIVEQASQRLNGNVIFGRSATLGGLSARLQLPLL